MKFELEDEVNTISSGEIGIVIGRSEYTWTESLYLVRHTNKKGRFDEWHKETDLYKADTIYPYFA